jgi:protein ImuA
MRQGQEAIRRDGDAPSDPIMPLDLLRDRIARITAGSGAQGFFNHNFSLLRPGTAVSQKHEPVLLGRDCRFDRLLGGGLKLGTLTEILPHAPGDGAATAGFLLSLAIRLAARPAKSKAAVIWIGEDFAAREQGALYGPGLALHGLDPARLILVAAQSAPQALWAMEEALKCQAPALVVGELWSGKPYDLVASRRLLLAAQRCGTPALLCLAGMAGQAGSLSSGADLRFEIRAHPSAHPPSAGSLPLPGAASWAVRIAKARIKARAGPENFGQKNFGQENFGIDCDRFHTLTWDHDEALFRDALPLALAADARDRSDHPALAQG